MIHSNVRNCPGRAESCRPGGSRKRNVLASGVCVSMRVRFKTTSSFLGASLPAVVMLCGRVAGLMAALDCLEPARYAKTTDTNTPITTIAGVQAGTLWDDTARKK